MSSTSQQDKQSTLLLTSYGKDRHPLINRADLLQSRTKHCACGGTCRQKPYIY